MAAFDDILAKRWSCQPYRFFHPPLFPGAPPVDRGAGPNSGPDSRELVGWKILVPPPSSGLEGSARVGRKGRDSGPCISSRWGLWTLEVLRLAALWAESPSPRPSPREGRGEEEEAPRFLSAEAGKFAASPYFLVPDRKSVV